MMKSGFDFSNLKQISSRKLLNLLAQIGFPYKRPNNDKHSQRLFPIILLGYHTSSPLKNIKNARNAETLFHIRSGCVPEKKRAKIGKRRVRWLVRCVTRDCSTTYRACD